MRTHRWSPCERTIASRVLWTLATAAALLLAGCQSISPKWYQPEQAAPDSTTEIEDADTGFTLVRADRLPQQIIEPPRLVYELAVLHVLVPQGQEAAMEKVWNFLREDALDADTQLRLRQNGLRVGIGHAQWWEPIKLALEAIEGRQVPFEAAVRAPVGFPLSLELDSEPREQTLFYVGPDGILSGDTWPDSRNVLRVAYAPDPHDADRITLLAVPEVRQKRDGWEWVRTEVGLWQVPRQAMQSFDIAGFAVTLSPGEFVLVAPSEAAHVYGSLGGAFLTRQSQEQHYSSYVFLRPEARHVGQHD
jgi:hypothetical protein